MHSPPFLYCLGKYLPAFLYLEAARVDTKRNTEEGIFRTTQRYRWRTGFAGLKASAKSLIVRSVMKYRFLEPLLAILKGPVSSVAFLTIKRGSVITVKDDQACGFVEVDYQGQIVLVLMRGIELRAHRVRGQAI